MKSHLPIYTACTNTPKCPNTLNHLLFFFFFLHFFNHGCLDGVVSYFIGFNFSRIHLQHEKEYQEIIDAIKGSDKEKRLASQFIGKFFKHFPNLADKAIDASLDLCEDENIQIRRQAIKDLPLLCKDSKEYTSRIGDILAQLLIVDDPLELQQVHMSLQQLLKYDAKGTLAGIVCIFDYMIFARSQL